MQTAVLAITLVLMAAVGLAFLMAVRSVNAEGDAGTAEWHRGKLFWGLVVAGVLVTVLSLREWPHALASVSGVVMVNATGGQWYWQIDQQEVPVGKAVIFNLHTEDVNHGFGVADSSGRLLFQTQAMPGYVNQVKYVFSEPGTYRVLCLEFCGVGHHDMIDEFEVVAN